MKSKKNSFNIKQGHCYFSILDLKHWIGVNRIIKIYWSKKVSKNSTNWEKFIRKREDRTPFPDQSQWCVQGFVIDKEHIYNFYDKHHIFRCWEKFNLTVFVSEITELFLMISLLFSIDLTFWLGPRPQTLNSLSGFILWLYFS